MSSTHQRWDLDEASLERALQAWDGLDHPPAELHERVVDWVRGELVVDPHKNAQPEFEEYFFQAVPKCVHQGQLVVCSYFTYGQTTTRRATVKIDQIALLTPPIGPSTGLIWPDED
ncbi:hypothetical protein [Actinoplanes sp. NPDC051494]|uniref:hypothetical protein n=1 Tax=Actinoplanes sp. NPDC051494 TaxID=3363907 RepID=UPI0037AF5071